MTYLVALMSQPVDKLGYMFYGESPYISGCKTL